VVNPRAIVARLSCSIVIGAVGVLGPCVAATPAQAQDAAEDQAKKKDETQREQLRDFIHFVRIARYDAAGALGQALLDEKMSPIDFVDLVEKADELERFEKAIAEAMRVPDLEPIAASMDKLYRAGKLARARQPEEIKKNIGLLAGGLRARSLGAERLVAAGEYAMPQLLETFLTSPDAAMRAQTQRVMVSLGRQAILPLCTALESVDPEGQEAIADVLALIEYRTSLPYLTSVHQTTTSERVRQATGRAIERLQGDPNANVASLFEMLGDAYYAERVELTSFPGEDYQLLWGYDPGLGLRMTAIKTPVFHEAMAMREAERSLEIEPSNAETQALWLAANYSREIDTPEGYANPVYGSERRSAEYFAIAAGADTTQRVIRRGIDTRDTPLVLRAINAVQRTGGPRTLWGESIGGRQAMLESLGYPNRRVQYEAALALGLAQPDVAFSGSQRVVPLLASAVRDAGERFAVVLTGRDRESYDRISGLLAGEGYTVLPPAEGGLGDIAGAVSETPGVDLIVTSLPLEQTLAAVDAVRSDAQLAVSPVLALMGAAEMEPARRRFMGDQLVGVRRSGIDDQAILASSAGLVETASGGPITGAEAAELADRSLAVLRDLAVSRSSVLDVTDAAAPLIAVMDERDGQVLMDIAEVLAHINQPRTQTALMERALAAGGPDEQLAMLQKVADSGKRYGNLLDDRLVRRLVHLASSDDEVLATQAAATMGSLGVPSDDLVPMILGKRADHAAAIVRER